MLKRRPRPPLHDVVGFGMADTKISRHQALRSVGEVVYVARIDGTIKFGHTTNLALRLNHLHGELLGFAPGTYDDEQAIHARLVDHRHHGREWYYPTPGVMHEVNALRQRIGLGPLAA